MELKKQKKKRNGDQIVQDNAITPKKHIKNQKHPKDQKLRDSILTKIDL